MNGPGDSSPFMQLAEAADYARMSGRTLRRAISVGALVAYKPGGRLIIRRDDLDAWIATAVVSRASDRAMERPRRTVRGDGKLGGLAELDAAIEAGDEL